MASVDTTKMTPPVAASKTRTPTEASGAPLAALVTRPLIPPAEEDSRTLIPVVSLFAKTGMGVAVARLFAET